MPLVSLAAVCLGVYVPGSCYAPEVLRLSKVTGITLGSPPFPFLVFRCLRPPVLYPLLTTLRLMPAS